MILATRTQKELLSARIPKCQQSLLHNSPRINYVLNCMLKHAVILSIHFLMEFIKPKPIEVERTCGQTRKMVLIFITAQTMVLISGRLGLRMMPHTGLLPWKIMGRILHGIPLGICSMSFRMILECLLQLIVLEAFHQVYRPHQCRRPHQHLRMKRYILRKCQRDIQQICLHLYLQGRLQNLALLWTLTTTKVYTQEFIQDYLIPKMEKHSGLITALEQTYTGLTEEFGPTLGLSEQWVGRML